MDDTAALLLAHARTENLPAFEATMMAVPVQRLSAVSRDETFHRAVDHLVTLALQNGTAERRLRILALIGRADNTAKRQQPVIAEAARRAVATQPPPLDADAQKSLTPDQRFYIGLVVARIEEPWVAHYAARALVEEGSDPRTKNDVRALFAEMVVERSATLADALRAIARAAPDTQHTNPGTKDADLSRARRLTRLLPAIEDAVRRTKSDSGDELADAFNAAMQALMFRFARPQTGAEAGQAAGSTVAAALMLCSTLLRMRFTLSVETEAYKTVGRAKYWWREDRWPTEARDARKQLEQTLLQAIELRARTGAPSRELLGVLIQLAGDRRAIEPKLAMLADPQMPPQVQDWLRAGGKAVAPRFATDAGEEAGLRDIDELLASSATRALHLQALMGSEVRTALAEVRAQTPDAARLLMQTLNYARALANDTVALARRRALQPFGEPGVLEEASATRHRREDGALIDTEMVLIEQVGIERVLPNGTAQVILPALVTPVEQKRK